MTAAPLGLHRRGRGLVLAALAGLGLASGAEPLASAVGVLLGLACLATALRTAPTWRQAALRGWLAVALGGAIVCRFVLPAVERFGGGGIDLAVLAWVVVAATLGLPWAVGAVGCHALAHRGCPFPLAFGAGVLVAGSLPAVFPWTPASLLTGRPELVQLADVLGARGTSAVLGAVVAVAVVGALGASGRRLAPLALAAALLVAVAATGRLRMDAAAPGAAGGGVRLALVDPRWSPLLRPDADQQLDRLDRLHALSLVGQERGAQAVVWPEAAFPLPLQRRTRTLGGTASPVPAGGRLPVLFGAPTQEAAGTRRWASAWAIEPGGRLVAGPVDKQDLLPFAERTPLGGLDGWRRAGAADLTPGARPAVLRLPLARHPAARVGVLFCFEVLLPGAGRRVAASRPRLLAELSNDGWFAGTDAGAAQEQAARLRAIETRTPLVRAVNGGPSGAIDAAGRVRARQDRSRPGVLVVRTALRPAGARPTPYVRWGDRPAWTAAAVLVLLPWRRLRRRRERYAADPRPS